MNVNEMTFGIEIETTIPANAIPVGGYFDGHRITEINGLEGWVAKHDGSIRAGRGRRGCEFVSPVLKGVDGLKSIVVAVEAIKRLGATVNPSCGLHVHVGFDHADRRNVEKVTTLVANFEKAIFAATGTKSRERGNYCGSVQQFGNFSSAIVNAGVHRYRVLNLATRKPTVEFRAFGGSLNAAKILGYVRLSLGLVERAAEAKRVTNWSAPAVAPTSPIKRSGEGQTALTRLYYQLGWTKGRTDRVYGNLAGDRLPPLTSTKRLLMKLARKYDGQP